jgi:hypothetical protein
MQLATPYLMNGCPKACWGCGQPFRSVKVGTEAIVGHDGRLYCYGTTANTTRLKRSGRLQEALIA